MAKDYLTFRLEMKRSQRENRTKKKIDEKKEKMFRLGVNITRVYKRSRFQNGVNLGKVNLVHPKWNLVRPTRTKRTVRWCDKLDTSGGTKNVRY